MLASQNELVVYALHSALNNSRIQPSLLPVFAETSLARRDGKELIKRSTVEIPMLATQPK